MLNWAIGIDMYTLMCIKWMTKKNLLYKKIKFNLKIFKKNEWVMEVRIVVTLRRGVRLPRKKCKQASGILVMKVYLFCENSLIITLNLCTFPYLTTFTFLKHE